MEESTFKDKVLKFLGAAVAGLLGLLFFAWMKKGKAEAAAQVSDVAAGGAKLEAEHQEVQKQIEEAKKPTEPGLVENSELVGFFNKRLK